MSDTIIRPAVEQDFETLCTLFAELDAFHRERRPELFQPVEGPPRRRDDVAGLIAGPNSTIFVACNGVGQVIGLATLIVRRIPAEGVRRARSYVEIDNLVVHARARRNGIGRALVRAASAWAQARWLAVELTVHAFNTDAIAFYAAVGFSALLYRMRYHGARAA